MTFELEADGMHFYCSSPALTRKLVERGARLIDPEKTEDLRRAIGSAGPEDEAADVTPPPRV
jgi:hypothetical protein